MKRVSSKGDLQAGQPGAAGARPKNARSAVLTEVAKEAANLIASSSAILATHDKASVVVVGAALSMVASSASLYSLAASSMDSDDDAQ